MKNTIYIYCIEATNRLNYILKLIFNNLLKVNYQIITNRDEFEKLNAPKINYSKQKFQNEPFIEAVDLLFETNIYNQEKNINVIKCNDISVFYKSIDNSFFEFDIFAASFYLVTRYEEYNSTSNDIHNRYLHTNSLAYKHNFIHIPLINYWVKYFSLQLKKYFHDLTLHTYPFIYQPTIDIDNAYAYLHKGWFRTTAAMIKSIVKFNFSDINNRIKTILKQKKDIYDTYDYIEGVHENCINKPIFFFLLGKYTKYDKNISVNNPHFKQLIRNIAQKYEVGNHFSYYSNFDFEQMQKENTLLSELLQKPITKNRQHFLMLKFPDTYNKMIKIGITNDYSMSYPSISGFRASIANPYLFFDLIDNTEKNLIIHPFQIMDVTLKDYQLLNIEQSIEIITRISNVIKQTGGFFISNWHNETFKNIDEWKNWNIVYESLLKIMK